jgi:hypothetical protein
VNTASVFCLLPPPPPLLLPSPHPLSLLVVCSEGGETVGGAGGSAGGGGNGQQCTVHRELEQFSTTESWAWASGNNSYSPSYKERHHVVFIERHQKYAVYNSKSIWTAGVILLVYCRWPSSPPSDGFLVSFYVDDTLTLPFLLRSIPVLGLPLILSGLVRTVGLAGVGGGGGVLVILRPPLLR